MRRRGHAGMWVAALVVCLALLPILALAWRAGGLPDFAIWQDAYLLRVLCFTLLQAGLSTVLSVVPALLVARALARRRTLPGRRLVLGLLGIPLVVPSVVAVLGVVSVFGTDGWLPLGSNLYGLTGILIAHVFFNLPLATRLLLPSLEQVPAAQWRLARQLGFGNWQAWRHIEWPALRGALPGAALLVFMLCLTSFAVVLTLGGGPRSTTLEVAIYQSLRFDFDPSRAVVLALVQLALCAVLAVFAARLTLHRASEIDSVGGTTDIIDSIWSRCVDTAVIAATLLVVGALLVAILIDGVAGPVLEVLGTARVWHSLALSTTIALLATLLSVASGWLITSAAAKLAADGRSRRADLLEIAGAVVYVVPPLVIGTGYFLIFHDIVDLDRITVAVVVAVNAMMGLPFVIRSLGPAMRQREIEYGRLCKSLDIRGWQRFRIIDFPLLRRTAGLAAALVTALSFGDLGVVALFAGHNQTTLPLLLYQYLSAYRIGEGAVIAVVLLVACLALFVLIERIVGGGKHALR
jgi:thiamine transport system permease protein